jgi:hypothetical protein
MASIVHTCYNCKTTIHSGIIRNSHFYCSEHCYSKVIKSCNYCFDKHDTVINPGINYKTLWFCSKDHLDLANPRPKISHAMDPIIGHPMGPIIGHPMGPIIGHPMGPIIGYPMGPIIGHPMGPIIGHPSIGYHIRRVYP